MQAWQTDVTRRERKKLVVQDMTSHWKYTKMNLNETKIIYQLVRPQAGILAGIEHLGTLRAIM